MRQIEYSFADENDKNALTKRSYFYKTFSSRSNLNAHINIKHLEKKQSHAQCATKGSEQRKTWTVMIDSIMICPNSATHDFHIFRNSSLKDRLERHPGLQDGIVFEDSGYACKPYLLMLYLRPTTRAKESYNGTHKKTRTQIERAFGWLKRRFGVSMEKSG